MTYEELPAVANLLASAKWAFSTRRVNQADAVNMRRDVTSAVSGDLLVGRVVSIGSHARVQLTDGRPSELYVGDLIVAACGARYASDQFEGVARISAEGADMLAGGGCIGTMNVQHGRMKTPTRIQPLALLCDARGHILNLDRYAMQTQAEYGTIPAIGVVGASMNAGKTSAVASLVHGLQRAGFRVAALKATGTGAFGDYNAYVDAGAHFAADFTDVGMVSTYLQPLSRIETGIRALFNAAAERGCNVAVVEFADGVLQQETAALLANPRMRELFGGFLYAVPDALAALGGKVALKQFGIEPLALTGLLTQSPLNVTEAQRATGLPVLSREALRKPEQAHGLFGAIVRAAENRKVA